MKGFVLAATLLCACGSSSTASTKSPTTNADGNSDCAEGEIEACTAACDGDDVHACLVLGATYEDRKDDGKAVAAFHKACDRGLGTACGALSMHYLEGRGVAADATIAASMASKGCDEGSAASCALAGGMAQDGAGGAQDYARAAKLYERGCALGEQHACSALGYLYVDGKGVARDEKKGAELIEKGCKGGDKEACKALGKP